jgi:ribosomal-protein-alanine N-acetyltransferase
MPAMELRGPQLTLRLPVADDAPALLELAGDPEVTRWFSWGPYRGVEEPLAWIEAQHERREAGEQLDFVVEHRDHGVIGVTGLGERSARDRRAMVGTWFGRDHWGTGANAESKAIIAHLAFAICGMERLGAYSNPQNARSTAALERLGFRREGTLRGWHRHGDRQIDVHVFGLLSAEWRVSPLRDVPVIATGGPPAAWRVGEPARSAKTCERCGQGFGCGTGQDRCWCSGVTVSREVLGQLRETYGDCLCPDCLVALAAVGRG